MLWLGTSLERSSAFLRYRKQHWLCRLISLRSWQPGSWQRRCCRGSQDSPRVSSGMPSTSRSFEGPVADVSESSSSPGVICGTPGSGLFPRRTSRACFSDQAGCGPRHNLRYMLPALASGAECILQHARCPFYGRRGSL